MNEVVVGYNSPVATLRDLPTPSFIVDLDTVERNCRRIREKAARSGVTLRPHVKTHKTIEGARLQLGSDSGPITVSTLAEAEFFARAGFRDITYAVPLAPGKLDRVAEIQSSIDVLHVLVDHPEVVTAIEEFCRAKRIRISAFIKVDCGYHRAGVLPESELALEVARAISSSGVIDLAGLLTHAGHAYHATNGNEIVAIATRESAAVSTLANRLRDAGIDPGTRSVGSTPTAAVVESFDGTDEVRPGNYVFFDVFQASIGACGLEDCAASVLASVISVYPERRQILIDAGALALSKDRGPLHVKREPGYGLIIADGKVRNDLSLTTLSQEHGQIDVSDGSIFETVKIGDRIQVLVNHSCLTAAMYDRYDIVREGELIDEWRPAKGW